MDTTTGTIETNSAGWTHRVEFTELDGRGLSVIPRRVLATEYHVSRAAARRAAIMRHDGRGTSVLRVRFV